MKIALPIPNPSPISYAESFSLSLVLPSSLLLESRKSSLSTSSHSSFRDALLR